MATSVGDANDNPQGIADLWAGDANDNPVHPAHAWVGDASDNPQQVDKPTNLDVTDGSFCDTSGQFDQPVYRQTWRWDNLHFGNVAHVELWVDDGGGFVEHETVSVGSSGQRQTETFGSDLGGGGHLTPGTYDCKVRYQYSDGSHSEYSSVDTVTVTNPCF